MTKKSYRAHEKYALMAALSSILSPFKNSSPEKFARQAKITVFPRPCLNDGHYHTNGNAFCCVSCCKEWRENNPHQGRPEHVARLKADRLEKEARGKKLFGGNNFIPFRSTIMDETPTR